MQTPTRTKADGLPIGMVCRVMAAPKGHFTQVGDLVAITTSATYADTRTPDQPGKVIAREYIQECDNLTRGEPYPGGSCYCYITQLKPGTEDEQALALFTRAAA